MASMSLFNRSSPGLVDIFTLFKLDPIVLKQSSEESDALDRSVCCCLLVPPMPPPPPPPPLPPCPLKDEPKAVLVEDVE
jgi:hypothetical protein